MGKPQDAFADSDVIHHGTFSMTGYSLPAGLTFEEWEVEGAWLLAIHQASGWWLGDWLRYGEHNFGEKYAQAIEATGLGLSTLKNAQWVADRIAPSERNPNVPYSHHISVASLEPKPRRALLKAAEKETLSEASLRRRVRDFKATGELDTGPEPFNVKKDVAVPRPLSEIVEVAIAELRDAEGWEDWKGVKRARQMLEDAVGATVDA